MRMLVLVAFFAACGDPSARRSGAAAVGDPPVDPSGQVAGESTTEPILLRLATDPGVTRRYHRVHRQRPSFEAGSTTSTVLSVRTVSVDALAAQLGITVESEHVADGSGAPRATSLRSVRAVRRLRGPFDQATGEVAAVATTLALDAMMPEEPARVGATWPVALTTATPIGAVVFRGEARLARVERDRIEIVHEGEITLPTDPRVPFVSQHGLFRGRDVLLRTPEGLVLGDGERETEVEMRSVAADGRALGRAVHRGRIDRRLLGDGSAPAPALHDWDPAPRSAECTARLRSLGARTSAAPRGAGAVAPSAHGALAVARGGTPISGPAFAVVLEPTDHGRPYRVGESTTPVALAALRTAWSSAGRAPIVAYAPADTPVGLVASLSSFAEVRVAVSDPAGAPAMSAATEATSRELDALAADVRAVRLADEYGPLFGLCPGAIRAFGELAHAAVAERHALMYEAIGGFEQCGCEATDLDRLEALAYAAFGAHDVRWVSFDPRAAGSVRTIGELVTSR